MRSANAWMSGSGLAAASSRSAFERTITADVEVVVIRISAVGMGDEVAAEGDVDAERLPERSLAARAIIRASASIRTGVVGNAARNSCVDHIDHAADRRRTEQQARPGREAPRCARAVSGLIVTA